MTRPDGRRELLIGVLVWVLAVGSVLPAAFTGWYPHDEGLLGQLGERTLGGEIPHRDFDDPYSGGLSWLYAAAFAVGGVRLATLRWVLVLAFALTVPFLYGLARRWVSPWLAAVATLVAVAWTVPNYFAGLPSWFNLFAAVAMLWFLLRHLDEAAAGGSGRSWLVAAGLMAGTSTAIKISGLYALAAALLVVVDQERRSSEAHADRAAPDRRYWVLAAVGGAAFVLALVALVRSGLSSGRSGSPSAVLVHFVVPGALLVGWLLLREWRTTAAAPVTGRLGRLLSRAGWVVAGWVVPVGALVAVHASTSSLPDLYRGLFVLPRLRLEFASTPLPPIGAVLAALPFALLVAWPWRTSDRIRHAIAIALAVGLGLALFGSRSDAVYRLVWLPARALLPVIVGVGLWRLHANRTGAPEARAQEGPVFACLATAAMVALIQYPDAFGIYFFYTVPPLVVAWLAVAAANRTALRASLLVVLVFAGGFALRALHPGIPGYTGVAFRAVAWDFPLELPRGGLTVDQPRGAEVTATVLALREHIQPGEAVLAAPDCPEIVFLSGARNPTRTFFEFFDPTFRDPVAIAAILDREQVAAVVINTWPIYSPQLPRPVVEMLFERYPNQQQIGRYLLIW